MEDRIKNRVAGPVEILKLEEFEEFASCILHPEMKLLPGEV